MVITILEAEVEEKNWQTLKDVYDQETTTLPESVVQTFLIQSQDQPFLWRIVTHWRSQKDLDNMRQTVEVPTGVRIFQSAGASPRLEIWNIAARAVGKHNTV